MVRTRVGYAGGTTSNPTYRSIGDHSEMIQIDYDPAVISYEELLDVFWRAHDPTRRPWSRQYMSIILYHNNEQKRLIAESKASQEEQMGRDIVTEIAPYTTFYRAEDYHQKYRLRQVSTLMQDFRQMYPDTVDFVDSTAAARVNGYVAGYGTVEQFQEGLGQLGLSAEGQDKLLSIVQSFHPGEEIIQCPIN